MSKTKIVYLIRNTTWYCGKIERFIVNFLRRRFTRRAQINEILNAGENTFQKRYIRAAVCSLQKRQIVKVNKVGEEK